MRRIQKHLDFPLTHLSVRVKSPCSLVDASRTMKEPSGLSRSFSFTSSLMRKEKRSAKLSAYDRAGGLREGRLTC